MSSNGLSYLSNQSLLSRIEILKKRRNYLYNQNKIFFNDTGYYLQDYKDNMLEYNLELDELEEEKNRRIQQLPVYRDRLSKAVARNKSKKAVQTLLTKPHYSELPKSFTSRFFSSLAGDRGLKKSILNHMTGEDLLPTKERVYLRVLQDKISELPEEVVKNIWSKLSKKKCFSNDCENGSSSEEPMPERSNSSGGKRRKRKRKKHKTLRNKTLRNKTLRNKTLRNKTKFRKRYTRKKK